MYNKDTILIVYTGISFIVVIVIIYDLDKPSKQLNTSIAQQCNVDRTIGITNQ